MPSQPVPPAQDSYSSLPYADLEDLEDLACCALLPRSARENLERRVLPAFLAAQPWCGGRHFPLERVRVVDQAVLAGGSVRLLVIAVLRTGGDEVRYLLPLALSAGERAERILETRPTSALGRFGRGTGVTLLHDGCLSPVTLPSVLRALAGRDGLATERGAVRWSAFANHGGVPCPSESAAGARSVAGEQSNSSACVDERWFVKLYRRLEVGPHPEAEVVQRLAEARFDATPRGCGAIVHASGADAPETTLGIVQELVPQASDLWKLTVETRASDSASSAGLNGDLAARLGDVTARLHVALAAASEAQAFAPEPVTSGELEARIESFQEEARLTLESLRLACGELDAESRLVAGRLLERAPALLPRTFGVARGNWNARAIRCHGDYHLGQVLARDLTGADGGLWIVDFEGEPDRPLSERRRKSLPLLDVAGMLRSFHYASCVLRHAGRGAPCQDDLVRESFLRSYWNSARAGKFLPDIKDAQEAALGFFCLEKAFYELRYELEHRPAWVWIPLTGLLELLERVAR